MRVAASIRNRLRVGLGAIALLLSLLAVANIVALTRLGSAVSTILRENYASVIACEDMKEALERQDSAAQFASSGREDIAAPMLADNRQAFARAFDVEANNITVAGEGELVASIRRQYAEYTASVDRMLRLPGGARGGAYFSELLPRFTGIKDLVQAVLRMNQANMQDADRGTKALAQSTMRIALAQSFLAVLFAAWLVWWLPRTVLRPVEVLAETARAVGEGNLAVKVEEPKVAELVPLAVSFRKMVERLRAYRDSSLGELLAAKDLARSTFECMLDPMVVLDPRGGVLLANAAAEEAFGLRMGSAEELEGAGVALPESLAAARDRVFATGEPVLPRSLSEAIRWRRLPGASGGQTATGASGASGLPGGAGESKKPPSSGRPSAAGERYYLVRALPLRVAPGEGRSAIVLAQDVTRFRRIDELKSDMVATVSHEFKTPLTSLRMATHLLLEPTSGPLTEAQRELVTTARDDAERLRTMVEDLLDVVRIEAEAGALHRVEVEPFGLLCEVVDAHRTVAREKGVTLGVDPTSLHGLVAMDPERVTIAVANLVSNAIRHTPSGGKVTVAARRSEQGALSISVSDTGEGLAPEDLGRLLEGTGPTSTGGRGRHGLGLTITREIALQHGGEVVASSTPGQGSVFTLLLPV